MTGHHKHSVDTTVDDGSRSALVAIFRAVVVGALIWLFAFSGLVFDRDGAPPRDDTTITNENNYPAPQQPAPQEPAPQQPAPSP